MHLSVHEPYIAQLAYTWSNPAHSGLHLLQAHGTSVFCCSIVSMKITLDGALGFALAMCEQGDLSSCGLCAIQARHVSEDDVPKRWVAPFEGTAEDPIQAQSISGHSLSDSQPSSRPSYAGLGELLGSSASTSHPDFRCTSGPPLYACKLVKPANGDHQARTATIWLQRPC